MKKFLLSLFTISLSLGLTAQTTIYTEDFESGSIPNGWSQTTSASDGGWSVGNSGALSSQYFTIPVHTNMAGTNDDGCNCDKSNDFLFTDTIDLQGAGSAVFLKFASFYYAATYQGATETATVEVSTNGGTTFNIASTLSGAENWSDELVNLSSYSGSEIIIGFRYKDAGGWLYGWAIDDLEIYEPVARDVEMTENSIPDYYDIDDAPLSITGTFTNYGADPVTSIEISYEIGGTIVTDNLTGLNIAPLGTHNFSLPTSWTPSAEGEYNVEIAVVSVNGNTDQINGNDAASKTILIYKDAEIRKPVYEVFTSSTCGPCKPGNENFHSVVDGDKGSFVEIKYQQDFPGAGDPYGTEEAINRRNYYAINSIPRMEIDGGWDQNASSFTTALHEATKEIPSFLILNSTHTIDVPNKTVNVNIDWEALANLSSSQNVLQVAIVEKLTTANVASNGETEFFYVMKKMLPNENGTTIGALTAGSKDSRTFSYTFQGSYRLPNNYSDRINHSTEHSVEEFTDLTVVAWIQDNATKEIFQGVNSELTEFVSTEEVTNLTNSVSIFPNPIQNEAIINLELSSISSVNYSIVDVTGKTVYSKDLGNLNSGEYRFEFNGKNFDSGLYLVNFYVNGEVISKRVSINN